MIIIGWIFCSLFVAAVFGAARKIGFLLSLVACLFLSPLIGFVITIISESNASIEHRNQLIRYQQQQATSLQNMSSQNNSAQELEKLIALKNQGHLSEEEFQKMKAKIVG